MKGDNWGEGREVESDFGEGRRTSRGWVVGLDFFRIGGVVLFGWEEEGCGRVFLGDFREK